MSWIWLAVMAAGAYAWKAVGVFALSRVRLSGPLESVAAHLPAALFAGLIVQQSVAGGSRVEIVTRLAGVVAGGLVAWRRGPLLAVVVTAAAVTALSRLLLS